MAHDRHHGSHSHSHHHDNTYLTSKNKKDPGVRITRIGLYVNCMMAASKALGGYLLNSQALLADAAHSFADLVSDILTLGTVSWSLRPPTDRFPAGYGKIESLGSLGVSGLLLVGGLGLGWHSCELLYHMWLPGMDALGVAEHAGHVHAHGHSHGGGGMFGHSHSHNPADMGIPNVHAAWIAGASILVKEYLYRATIKIARERKSSVLASNAVHHRIDSLTSIVALAAILGSNVFSNVAWLDPIGGLLVSLMVIRAGWANTGNALLELADVSIDHETRNSISTAASDALSSESFVSGSLFGRDVEIREVQGIKAGQSYLIDLKLGVPESIKLRDTAAIEEIVRERLSSKVRGLRRIRIKFVSRAAIAPELKSDFVSVGSSRATSPEQGTKEHHDHLSTHSNGHTHGHEEDDEETLRRR